MSKNRPTHSDSTTDKRMEDILAARRQVEAAREHASPPGAAPSTGARGPRAVSPTLGTDSIGGYALLSELHRGGQGTVYLALQESTQRQVAIKVMHDRGAGEKIARVRFERETHVLGRLNHPNIVAIHDSGSAAEHAYYVMDYVAGVPLDLYIKQTRLNIEQTLRLFVTVCDAVHEAHVRGIIHRDLKPGNILVDDRGRPRILDFGLAKVTTDEEEPTPTVTVSGQFIGSLPWSAPEQVEGHSTVVDTRTDVYSLGVMFYQMLTGRFPYNVTGTAHEVMDRILHAEPTRPGSVRRAIDDELDTIVLKCLSKERERRYDNAGHLARDLRCYLSGEPIEAKRDSGWYVFKKTLARHKAHTAVAAGFAAVIGLALIVSLTLWRNTVRERDRAVLAERVADEQRVDAEAARDEAEAVTEFLVDTLSAADPSEHGKDVTVREVLDKVTEQIGEKFAEKPLIEARIRDSVASTYGALGLYDRAEEHAAESAAIFRRELGERDRRTLLAVNALAVLLSDRGQFGASEAQHRATLEIRRRVLGEEHPDTLRSINNLAGSLLPQGRYTEAEALFRQTLDIMRRVLGEEHPDALASKGNLAIILHKQGRSREAEVIGQQVVKAGRRILGEEYPATLRSINSLANVLDSRGRHSEAEALHRQTLEIRRRILGEEHPDTLASMNNLAISLRAQARYGEAEALDRQTLEVRRRVRGEEHPQTLLSRSNLAAVLYFQGRYAEAEALDRQTLEIRRRVLGEEHPETAQSMHNLADSLRRRGRYAEAEALDRHALEIRRRVLGEEHPATLWSMENLAETLARGGNLSESEFLYREVIERHRARAAKDHASAEDLRDYASLLLTCEVKSLRDPSAALPAAQLAAQLTGRRISDMLTTLALALHRTGQHANACATQREGLALLPPEPSLLRADMESRLGEFLTAEGRFAEAEPLLLGGYEWMNENWQGTPDRLHEFIERLVKLYEAWDAAEPGQSHAEKAAEWRQENDVDEPSGTVVEKQAQPELP